MSVSPLSDLCVRSVDLLSPETRWPDATPPDCPLMSSADILVVKRVAVDGQYESNDESSGGGGSTMILVVR